jgi:hypothetical protein
MTKQVQSTSFAACIPCISLLAIVFLLGAATAQAKQCNAERPSDPKAHWSYRLIDGRKCWYEGENGLSKSLLEWRANASARPANLPVSLLPPHFTHSKRPTPQVDEVSSAGTDTILPLSPPAQRVSNEAPIRILTVKPDNTPALNDGFEDRWRALEVLGK